jgi:beta-phosphoglucomutase-like phosphatase (HAD superfamily)
VAKEALLDVDGTLVETNYHHALAWYRAFHEDGAAPPMWRIHRHIGMGGDQLVPALVPGIDRDRHEAIERARKREYAKLIGEVQPFADAHGLIAAGTRRSRGRGGVRMRCGAQGESRRDPAILLLARWR